MAARAYLLALIHEEEKNIPGLFSFLHLLFAIPPASTPVKDPFFPPRSQNGGVQSVDERRKYSSVAYFCSFVDCPPAKVLFGKEERCSRWMEEDGDCWPYDRMKFEVGKIRSTCVGSELKKRKQSYIFFVSSQHPCEQGTPAPLSKGEIPRVHKTEQSN